MSALFHQPTYTGDGRRAKGVPRYKELLDRDWKRLFLVNVLTWLCFLPLTIGIVFSVLSSSILVLIPACIIGGAVAGPGLSCLYDTIFRSLRDAPGQTLKNYTHAWHQNWRSAIVPGILLGLLIGFYTFMLMLFSWSAILPSAGTIVVYSLGFFIITMFLTAYWPLIVLFDQPLGERFHNFILFITLYFWKTTGCAALQFIYWLIFILFLPWSGLLLPFVGIWWIFFTTQFLLYPTMNEVFHIEEAIAKDFPEQVPFYEDDEAWLKRKQEESHESDR